MLFLVSLYYSWPIILIFLIAFAIWSIVHNARSPKVFERRNHETLRRYQAQISHLASEINDPSTDIRAKLKGSLDAVDCYEKLCAFCSQTRSGEEWFSATCSFPKSQAEKAATDYANLLAEFQEFRSSFFPVVSPDEKIQSDWLTLLCDHDSREQLTRQKRSIRTLPVYVDHNMRRAYFLSSDMTCIYDVRLFDCTCPDHEKRVLPCKHMYRLFYELTVGTDYTIGINAPNLNNVTGFLELPDEDKVSYIRTVYALCGKENLSLTTRKLPHIVKALQTGLLLQSDTIDYASLLDTRTKDEILISLRDFGITDCYPSWTKVRLIDFVTKNHRRYLEEEYNDFTAVTIPPTLEPWCKGFCSVIESRFIGNTDFLEEWNRRFDKFL